MGVVSNQPYPQPPARDFRLSDAERADALAQLTFAYGEGRLDPDEYDRRCDAATQAATHRDLEPLFRDLPAQQPSHQVQPYQPAPGQEVEVYTRHELATARKNGQHIRLGIFGLGSILSFGGGIVLAETVAASWAALPVFIIPTLFILLYIMKVGPDSWYTPSPAQLERKRLKDMRTARLLEEERRKALRAAQRDQLTGDAMGFAQDAINRFKR
nr:Domain of uncharacterised function (DUF1707) [Streptococcus thermophilus]